MPEQPGQERTEEATPRKRMQARRKGTVARSQDLTNAVVIVALLMILPSVIGNLGSAFLHSTHTGLSSLPYSVEGATINRYCIGLVQGPLMAFLPPLAVALSVGLAANFAQVGFVLSGESLQ